MVEGLANNALAVADGPDKPTTSISTGTTKKTTEPWTLMARILF